MPRDQLPKVGEDITDLMPKVGDDITDLVNAQPMRPRPAHDAPAPAPLGPRQPAAGRGTSFSFEQQKPYLDKYAVPVGATLGVMALPEMGLAGLLARPAMAYAGGYAGAKVADKPDPNWEGIVQALTQTMEAPQTAVRAGGKGMMEAHVPDRVTKDFHNVDVPQQLLDRGFFPGWGSSARRAANETTAATAERLAAAHTVPPINPVGVVSEHRDLFQKAKLAGEPDRARAIFDAAKKTVGDVRQQYPRGMPGPAQLARKDIKYEEGIAAVRGSDALTPNLKKAEGDALAANIRQSPRAAAALDNSQQLMAINQVMDEAGRDNIMKRLKGGGIRPGSIVSAVAGSPKVNSVIAHAMNQGSRVLDPNVVRLLTALMSKRSNQDETP